VSEFEFSEKKEDFFLFFGRVIEEKGIHLAIQATEKLGVKLVVAGPGSLSSLGYKQTPNHVECIGPADAEARKDLMKRAKGLLGLTYYVEPFGNMTIEANLSGTPAITTDWGGFTETVIEGKTGYRVRNFRELIDAMKNIESIKPIDCRNHGLNYSDEAVHDRHYEYILRVKRNGFYDE
jgi:glycosyltransferase involved in cell wall biosynthesis